jgi:nucleoside-diphosphate-sugar epimerase
MGRKVRVVDNLSTGRLDNLAGLGDSVDFVEGNICDKALMVKVSRGIDVILHNAAWRAVGRSVDDPWGAHDTNCTGALSVLEAAREERVKRVVLASSAAVYGDQDIGLYSEDLAPRPESPYAVAKLASEYYGSVFSKLYGLDTISLRYFNVFGPYQRAESEYSLVVPIFLDHLLRGQAPEIHGDGEQRRDFVYVDDVARACFLAGENEKRFIGRVYNIGSGTTVSINEVYQTLQRGLGVEIEPKWGPRRAGDVNLTCADISLAKDDLGYESQHSFEEGIERSIRDYKRRLVKDEALVSQGP